MGDIGLADSLYILAGGRRMEYRKFQFMDRRQDMGMPKVPFKDSNGATIRVNRRIISNRRLDDINFEWSDICSM
jgi:hypothetical protein